MSSIACLRPALLLLLALASCVPGWAQTPPAHQHPPPDAAPPPGGHTMPMPTPVPSPTPEREPSATPTHDMANMPMATPAHVPTGPLAITVDRDGSGTSWLPDASPMHALHGGRGPWQLMLHGNAALFYSDEGGRRGDAGSGSVNWVMGMARRPLAGGELGLRAMLSAEPATVPSCGYPLLLASGETCGGGRAIHDHQHPHDAFMELAALYRRELGASLAGEAYAALAGEPALGPTAYPHRLSAFANPAAPIAHHWLDSTHISFGVLTAGVFGRRWKAEASLFNGREPDEQRWDLDLGTLDSYSARLWWLPGERWAVQASAGHLREAERGEPGEPRRDVDRATASATYHLPLSAGRLWATTLAWGHNREGGRGTPAWLLESNLALDERQTLFGRLERVAKTGHDLALEAPALEERPFTVGSATLGYLYELPARGGWRPGVGLRVSVQRVPADLEPFYGLRHPLGWGVFLNLRPAAMAGMGH